ncbi:MULTISPECIES: hypothetical protein [Halorussus]|uniref:Uncharacterized protein n=2 Tax=Halorussus TaxID=1070314 RepID=A0A8U0HV42_9EURY|nr:MULTISPECIES: hypothetical protein [Halorussus]UPV74593.1 hypothetical protein M0R89_00645 [Halorussus limi]
MATLKTTSADESVKNQVDVQADELGISMAEFLNRAAKLAVMADNDMLRMVAGENVSIEGVQQSDDDSSDESDESEYNELSLGHDRLIDPDEADFSDNDVLKQSNRQRVVVLEGILAWKREHEDDFSHRVTQSQLESIIRTAFGVSRSATVDKIITLAEDLDVLYAHVTNDRRLRNAVDEMVEDVVRAMELKGSDEDAKGYRNNVNKIRDLSGEWSTDDGRLVEKWFKPSQTYFTKEIVARQASLTKLNTMLEEAPDRYSANRVLTRMMGIAVEEGWLSEDEAADLHESKSVFTSFAVQTGSVESLLSGDGVIEVLEEKAAEKRREERLSEDEAREKYEELVAKAERKLENMEPGSSINSFYDGLFSETYNEARDLAETYDLDMSRLVELGEEYEELTGE